MKRQFLICFLFFSLICFGQKYDVIVYLKNGSVKKGKGDYVDNGESKMKFIEDSQSKKERIKYDDIEKVEYHDNKTNEPFVLERKETSYKRGSGKPVTEVAWLNKTRTSGDISAYVTKSYSDGYTNMSTGNTMTASTFIGFYFQYKDKMPEMIYFNSSDNYLTKKKWVGNFIENFFKDLCPNMANDFRNGKIKLKEDASPLLDYYEKNCSK
ncbi:hypothetical protein [Epilithonimonas mollis]|uniref:Uncharacterized protein n=1 Tax=Epilithonimonas mollis TaxID=216903 RepID=A0A1M6RJU7_9FLAO|nr:hypothetical protein [Epilithonimonas mollis]SHK32755.1 hypothetical protein SAMN05444371_1948 [Epilithonimonas mollis]